MKNIAIRENHLYKKAYVKGSKAYGKYTVIYVLKDLKAYKLKKENPRKQYVNRIGLAVTKKIGGAVVRNRVKRIIRAALHEVERSFTLKKGNLIVISAREDAKAAKSTDIHAEMIRQLTKLSLIKECPLQGENGTETKKEVLSLPAEEKECNTENAVTLDGEKKVGK